jgi:tetratricopeptide (TPR) repeat protein
MEKEQGLLEREAQGFLEQEKVSEAYSLFKKAGDLYRRKGNYKAAALCLASAASCWALKSGEKIFYNAAIAYEDAADSAELAGDLEYASLLYRQAAINFERDMEFFSFSNCFYRSRECLRRFLMFSIISPQKIHHITASGIESGGVYGVIRRFVSGIFLTLSALIWGHGERPNRTFYSALFLIFSSAFFYMQGNLIKGALIFKPNFLQALYFSTMTFTTVGYGDISPIGLTKLAAMIEAFCGIFIIPIFIIALSRKYLRI